MDDQVILDFETTGLGPSAEPVEVGICNMAGVPVFEALVKARKPSEPEAFAVHGLDVETLSAAYTFTQLHPAILSHLERACEVLTWSYFDVKIWNQTCIAYALPLGNVKWVDARGIYRRLRPEVDLRTGGSLMRAAAAEGLDQVQVHRALSDCQLIAAVLRSVRC